METISGDVICASVLTIMAIAIAIPMVLDQRRKWYGRLLAGSIGLFVWLCYGLFIAAESYNVIATMWRG
jgi:hypothetical protein